MRQPPVSSNRRGSDYSGYIPPSLKRHGPEIVVENGTEESPALVHKGLAQNPNRAEMPGHSSKRKGSYEYANVSTRVLPMMITCFTNAV